MTETLHDQLMMILRPLMEFVDKRKASESVGANFDGLVSVIEKSKSDLMKFEMKIQQDEIRMEISFIATDGATLATAILNFPAWVNLLDFVTIIYGIPDLLKKERDRKKEMQYHG